MKRLLLIIIKFYQKAISPFLMPSCRYSPSCSNYALTAIERFGTFKGIIMSTIRIFSCNPLFNGGNDFVPDYWPGWVHIFRERFERLIWRK
ncbi:MAG TPA: membrane protein insertion efficiency factor YidD [Bacteroidales bacterium]|nr:membrane protein insertion efficiency factor YidD [Bacteroidales bacterium]